PGRYEGVGLDGRRTSRMWIGFGQGDNPAARSLHQSTAQERALPRSWAVDSQWCGQRDRQPAAAAAGALDEDFDDDDVDADPLADEPEPEDFPESAPDVEDFDESEPDDPESD